MEGVLEQMTSIERYHGDQISESEEDVDPHQPEKEVDEEQQSADANHCAKPFICGCQHGFFHWVHRNTLELERYNHQGQYVDWSINGFDQCPPLKAR